MNLDSLTFDTSRLRDGRWQTRCPQLDIRATAGTRADAIRKCVSDSFQRFYELDADRRFGDTA